MNKEKIIKLKEKLDKAINININDVDINSVQDINEINISRKKEISERIVDFIESSDNPYLYKINGILVKIEFGSNKRAEQCLLNALENLYK